MNKQQFKTYKKELKQREKSFSSSLWLVIYACLIYLFFGSFNICGKIFLTYSYLFPFSSNLQKDDDYIISNLCNIQWSIYYLVSPWSLQLTPQIISKLKFKILLFLAALGSILFLTPGIFQILCEDTFVGVCNSTFIIFYAIIVSIISGLMQSFLLFSMMFYLSNLAHNQDKVIYYSCFFFMYCLQWLMGSLIGDLFFSYIILNNVQRMAEIYGILLLIQLFISLFFLTLPEKDQGRYLTFQKTIFEFFSTVQIQKETKKEIDHQDIRQLLLEQHCQEQDENEDDTFDNLNNKNETEKQEINLQLFKSQLQQRSNSLMTLQCFSIEQKSLIELLESKYHPSDISTDINLDTYQNKNYIQKLFLTWQKIQSAGFQSILLLIGLISCIQSFLLIYFFLFFAIQEKFIQYSSRLLIDGYMYLGIGELIGSFSIGLLGDQKDKLIALQYILTLFQFGCIIAWMSLIFKYQIFILVFSCATGFCDSFMTSTVISILTLRFPKYIFLVDLMYFCYTLSFALISLILISCNYQHSSFASLLILQIIGLFGCYSAYYCNKQSNKNDTLNKSNENIIQINKQ